MIAIGRDIALTVIGLGGIVHQEVVGPVKPELLIVYTTLLGTPMATNLLALARGVSRTDTDGRQLPSAPDSSASAPR